MSVADLLRLKMPKQAAASRDSILPALTAALHRAEPYLDALERLHHVIVRVEPKTTFVDGDDVVSSMTW